DQVALAALFRPVRGVGARVRPAAHGPQRQAVYDRTFQVKKPFQNPPLLSGGGWEQGETYYTSVPSRGFETASKQAAVAQRRNQADVAPLPDAGGGPLGEAPPAGAARAPAQLGGQRRPTEPLAEDEEDAVEAQAVGDPRPPALGGSRVGRKQGGEGV